MKVAISNYLKILPYKYTLFRQPNKVNMLRDWTLDKPVHSPPREASENALEFPVFGASRMFRVLGPPFVGLPPLF